jgi:hypothetical protein
MRIDGIEIYRVAMPLIKPWITAYVEHLRNPRFTGAAVTTACLSMTWLRASLVHACP